MELSIVAVVINNLNQTKRFISSIRDYTKGKYELIIIDNGSSDKETINYIKNNSDIYFRFDKLTDLSKAWNKGIKLSKGKYVAIANNDVVVPPNWFPLMKEIFVKRKKAGMVYPLTYWTLRYNLKMGRISNLTKPIKIPRWRQGVWGEFNVFPRKILDEINYFSEEYLEASGEDLDILYKLHQKNYGVYIQPKVFIFHEGGATGNNISKEKLDKMYDRNWKLFLKKWKDYKDYILDRV
tara:strand:- start:129 stop:842 length:714 start_codon:yes stop_codon:yes gene_type:complete